MWTLLVSPLPQYKFVVKIRSRRDIPGAADACVMALPYESTVQSAPLTPFLFMSLGLYRMPLPGRGEKGKGMRSRLGSHW